jgi:hypothetical protein
MDWDWLDGQTRRKIMIAILMKIHVDCICNSSTSQAGAIGSVKRKDPNLASS